MSFFEVSCVHCGLVCEKRCGRPVALRQSQLSSVKQLCFRKQECVKLGDELAEVLFLLPVSSAALTRVGVPLCCPTPGLPGAHGGYFYMLSLPQETRAGEAMLKSKHYFLTDFIHDNPRPPLMWISITQLALVILTPMDNLISYIRINFISGVISWKLRPSLVPGGGASLGARTELGDLSSAQPAGCGEKCHGKSEDRGWHPPRSECGRMPAAGAGAGWSRWDRAATSPSWRHQAQWGWSSRQDLGLRGVMLPAWRGRPGGDQDIWWEFLMAELCVGLGCRLI